MVAQSGKQLLYSRSQFTVGNSSYNYVPYLVNLKTLVYHRVEQIDSTLQLEGLSLESEFSPNSSTGQLSSFTSGQFFTHNSQNDKCLDEMDGDINIDDLPERLSDTAGLGNMPELTMLLEDDDVIEKFDDPTTAQYLRQISMDPSAIESLKSKPEIMFMLAKIEEIKRKLNKGSMAK
jgi:hypothetical protein